VRQTYKLVNIKRYSTSDAPYKRLDGDTCRSPNTEFKIVLTEACCKLTPTRFLKSDVFLAGDVREAFPQGKPNQA
jgi:hypothetical protein